MVREGGKFYRRSRFWATSAVAELCKDTVRVVPLVIKWGCVDALAQIIKDYTRGGGEERGGTPQPLLRPALSALNRICKFPLGAYTINLVDAGLKQPLVAIASNVKLQIEYAGVKCREGLGGFARDILYAMTEAEGRRNAGIGPTGGSLGGSSVGTADDFLHLNSMMGSMGLKGEEEKKKEELEGEEEEEYEDEYEDEEEEKKLTSSQEEDGSMTATSPLNATFDGTYSGMGVTAIGSLADDVGSEDETGKMRISQMDAADPAFRNELKRRKEHYEMGATYRLGSGGRRKSVTESETKSSGRKRRGSVGKGSRVVEKIEAVKDLRGETMVGDNGSSVGGSSVGGGGSVEEEYRTAKTPATAKTSVSFSGLSRTGTPAASRGGDLSGVFEADFEFATTRPGVLDVKAVPLLTSTRPPGLSPKNKSGPPPPTLSTSKSLPSPLLATTTVKGGKGKNLVTFTRPKKSNGLFVDPTFVEVAPVSGLAALGNKEGEPSMLSSASLTAGKPFEEIETYTHTVDIMGSKVKISGQRVAGPNPVLDDGGRPLSAVTFENVHEATVRRELEKLRSAFEMPKEM